MTPANWPVLESVVSGLTFWKNLQDMDVCGYIKGRGPEAVETGTLETRAVLALAHRGTELVYTVRRYYQLIEQKSKWHAHHVKGIRCLDPLDVDRIHEACRSCAPHDAFRSMKGLFVDLTVYREIHLPCSIGDAGHWILAVFRVAQNGPCVCIFDPLRVDMVGEKKALASEFR
jgi:hypothetical protein